MGNPETQGEAPKQDKTNVPEGFGTPEEQSAAAEISAQDILDAIEKAENAPKLDPLVKSYVDLMMDDKYSDGARKLVIKQWLDSGDEKKIQAAKIVERRMGRG